MTQPIPSSERARQRKITAVYDKLHEGKLGAHWLWCVIEQIANGVSEEEAMQDYGYYASASLPAPTGWQPIETAPKDGEIIVLASITNVHVMIRDGRWDHHANKWTWPWTSDIAPDLWMPLPAAPGQGDGREG